MHTITMTAALAALSISALAQQAPGTTSTPCAPASAKTKVKQGLGNVLRGIPVGQAGATNNGCPAPQQAQTATPQPASGPAPAKPGESMARDDYFTPRTQGRVPVTSTLGNGYITWVWGDPEFEQKPSVLIQLQRGSPTNLSYAGHSGQDYYFVNDRSGSLVTGRTANGGEVLKITIAGGRGTLAVTGLSDPPAGLSGLIVNDEPPPPPGIGPTGGYSPLTYLDDARTQARLTPKPDAEAIIVTRKAGDPQNVWRAENGHHYLVNGQNVTDLDAKR